MALAPEVAGKKHEWRGAVADVAHWDLQRKVEHGRTQLQAAGIPPEPVRKGEKGSRYIELWALVF